MRFVAIRSEGGLLPYDLLEKIEEQTGQKLTDFGLPKGRRLEDEISRSWSDVQSLWDYFKRKKDSLPEKDPYGTSLTRDRWIVPLLVDTLGFELKFQPAAALVNNQSFHVSHRAGEGGDAVPVHIEGCKIDLDRRLNTKLRTSPQAMIQEFLNNSEPALWGIVTNGLCLRLLRDSSRTARPTYVEFDLESILEGNRFNEFAVFYRLCHRTRLPRSGEEASQCLLEDYYQHSIEQGLRVRDDLRDGVERSLKILANAFLQHPDNSALRERFASGRLTAGGFHRQLLLLVYRLLFLMVAEERGLIVSLGESADSKQKIYNKWYSVSRLRDRSLLIPEESPFCDLWIGLRKTFWLFEYGVDKNALSIPPLNGDLFNENRSIPDLAKTSLFNHELLLGIRHLSVFKDKDAWQKVNYSALDVEELGSVYESLLDFQPNVSETDGTLTFELRTGMERKSTGSYYTRPELVHELVESALVPVMEDRLAQAEKATADTHLEAEKKAKEKALLGITVCDPACGSGHFLLAAARRLGKELARIRTGEDEPTPQNFHLAVRDVISHCIYGVDLNPLAVDLCKLALWLEGHWAGKPLSFLDHRIKNGNSLIGVLDPRVLADGIPDEAFSPVAGDDKKVAAALKKRNRQERTSKQIGLSFDTPDHTDEYAAANREIGGLAEESAADVRKKAEMYSGWRMGMQQSHDLAACDLWTAQFFVPLKTLSDPDICTTKDFREFAVDKAKKPQQVAAAQAVAQRNHFFHWHLEFPEIFDGGGFDVILGNPPWERMKLQEEEHWSEDAYIMNARNQAERRRRLDEYRHSADEKLRSRVSSFDLAKHAVEAAGKFARESGRFLLTAVGDLNTYALFAELAYIAKRPPGRCGLVLPVNIVTDDSTKEFFAKLVADGELTRVVGFENEAFIFPSVHHAFKFCVFVITGHEARSESSKFVFFCRYFEDVNDPRRQFQLTASQLALLNPNTRNCPIFRTGIDAQMTLRLYESGWLFQRETPYSDPWRLSFQRMYDMASDSALFEHSSTGDVLPLYEAKMFWQFDHRFSTYENATAANLNSGILPQPSDEQKKDPSFVVKPRYWVPKPDVIRRTSTAPHF